MKRYRSIITKNKTKLKEFFHPKDDLMRGITFEELIETVQSNEKEITPQTVMKVFNEIHKTNKEDALAELRDSMSQIIKETK